MSLMSDSSSAADLPNDLKEMLRDEANLATARQVLEDARNDFIIRDEELRAQKPKLSLLVSKKQREEYSAALQAMQKQIGAVDKILGRVASARERLHIPLRAAILHHVKESDPLYRQGLRAARFHEHWRRCHAVVQDRLIGFLRDMKAARNAVATDAASGQAVHSEDATWCITNLHGSSVELDREIDALNRWASEQAELVKGTPFANVRLPLLEGWGCVRRTDALARIAPADALAALDQMLSDFLEYRQPSLETIAGMFQAAADEHGQIAETRLRQRWSDLLAYAEAHWVSDAEIEATLIDIEQRLTTGERARLAAQLPFDPFMAER